MDTLAQAPATTPAAEMAELKELLGTLPVLDGRVAYHLIALGAMLQRDGQAVDALPQ